MLFFLGDTNTGIPDKKFQIGFPEGISNFDVTFLCELQCIVDQVIEHLF